MFQLQEELKKLPEKPGVYIMHDAAGGVIYVGKAVVLKNRVRSYFQKTAHNERITQMIARIASFEYIVTDSEYEALLLECNLIKKYKPKYNVLLKDDKGYPYIKVTVDEPFPRVELARKIVKDKSRYFGPYYSNWTVETTLDALRRIFPLRLCKKEIQEHARDRVCLNYHIGLCLGPCGGMVSREEYGALVDDVCDFLSGKSQGILEKLDRQMRSAADRLEFEKAALYRERIRALERVQKKQKVASLSEDDFDVAALEKNDVDACVQIFFVRGGKVIGRDFYLLDGAGPEEDKDIMAGFLKQFYRENQFIPPRVYLECIMDPQEIDLLAKWMTALREHKCELVTPQRGDKRKLALMVKENAKIALMNHTLSKKTEGESDLRILNRLQDILELPELPLRIEAYDISNTGDSDINASMVVFVNGRPCKKEYRLYQMKTMQSRNDVGCMKETLERRFQRWKDGDQKFALLPDLLLVDGGITQVRAAQEVLESYDLSIPVFGMVKDDRHKTRGLIQEDGEFPLKKDLDLWRFVSSVQNEAHRFALEYNRKLREKRYKKSVLDDIPGIGSKRKVALLRHFGSLAAIRSASVEELQEVKGITEKIALAIRERSTSSSS